MKIIVASLLLSLATVAAAGAPQLTTEEFMLPAVDPGIRLYARNKYPQGVKKFAADRILLYVHGATYPSETAFDLRLNGLSWMDYIARAGYDVWLGDGPRHGGATPPPP